jgi:hypothetical protein
MVKVVMSIFNRNSDTEEDKACNPRNIWDQFFDASIAARFSTFQSTLQYSLKDSFNNNEIKTI